MHLPFAPPLAPMLPAAATWLTIDPDFRDQGIIRSGDIALIHTHWDISSLDQRLSVDAIEVARRQPDETWRWFIGDPFTIGRRTAS